MKAFIRKNFYYFALALLFIIAFFLRSYRLTELPDIVHIDEAGLGINAWSLANYGIDRHLNEMPFYVQNFDDSGQSPLYTYSVALLISLFGKGKLSLLLARIPGMISSMLVVIFGTKNMSMVFQNRKITLMSAFLLTICPYFIMHGRFAIDCNLMLGCSMVSLYFLVKYIRTQKLSHLILCGISFGITLYSYALSYFVIPLFLVLIAFYLLYTGKITFRHCVVWAVVVCVTGLPVILFASSLIFQWEPIHFLGFVISPVASDRVHDVASESSLKNIATMLKITLTYDAYPFNAVEKFCTLYVISIPFVIIGFCDACKNFFVSLKKRCFHFASVYWLFFLCGIITVGLTTSNIIYRGNYYYISYLYFLVSGIYGTYRFVRSYRYAFISILGACYLLWGLSFCRYYFTLYSLTGDYKGLYVPTFEEAVADAVGQSQIQDIYIDCHGMSEYLYFFYPKSPYELVAQKHENGYGRYHFTLDSDTEIDTKDAYIVNKENESFVKKMVLSGTDYERIEYEHYYLFYYK